MGTQILWEELPIREVVASRRHAAAEGGNVTFIKNK
jgi:hypothetical protein